MANIVKVAIIGDSKSLESASKKGSSSLASFGQKAGKIGAAFGVSVAAIGVAAGVGLFKVGETFDEAYDHIRTTTGKTGKQLDGLQADFRKVFGAVPTDAGSAGTAIATLSQKLGLTGKPLQKLAEQELELSRITKTDLAGNLESTTNAFNNFGVKAEAQSGKLDEMFRASQQTGISVGDLSDALAKNGVTLRAAGLDFDQSVTLVAGLHKAGLDASQVMPAVGKALAVAAKEGKPASQVFAETFKAIKDAPNDTAAAGVALTVFGAKAGPKLAAAIREGKLSLDDLQKGIVGGSDTVLKASAATQDFGEKWTKLKNKVLLAIAPLAAKVFNAVGDAMDRLPALGSRVAQALKPTVDLAKRAVAAFRDAFNGNGLTGSTGLVGFMEKLGLAVRNVVQSVQRNWPKIKATFLAVLVAIRNALQALAVALGKAFDFANKHKEVFVGLAVVVGTVLVAAFVSWAVAAGTAAIATAAALAPAIALGVGLGVLVAAIVYAWKHFEIFRDIVKTTVAVVQVTVRDFVGAVESLWQRFGATIVSFARTAFGAVRNVVQGVLTVLVGIVKVFAALFTGNWSAMWNGLKQIAGGAIQALAGIFHGAIAVLTLPFRFIANAVRGNVDNIFGFFKGLPGRIASVMGGIIDIVLAPFRTALNGLVSLWNNTVGKIAHGQHIGVGRLSVSLPDLRIAGSFAGGGVVPGAPGSSQLIEAHGGETIRNRQQEAALSRGGNTYVTMPTASPALVRQMLRRHNRRNGVASYAI